MASTFHPFALLSITAIGLKFVLLFFKGVRLRLKEHWFLAFFLSLLLLNVFELTCIFHLDIDTTALVLIKAFHLSCLLVAATLLGLTLRIVGRQCPIFHLLIYTSLVVATSAIILPDMAIIGVQSLGFAITRIPGPTYWVFQLTLLGYLTTIVYLLVSEIFNGISHSGRRRAKALLISILPLILGGALVVILMQLGFRINAIAVGSTAAIFFLIALIITDSEVVSTRDKTRDDRLYRFLALFPATSEFRFTNIVRRAIWARESTGFQASVGVFEKALILQTLQACSGNKSMAAKKLGISRTTLRRKLEAIETSATHEPL